MAADLPLTAAITVRRAWAVLVSAFAVFCLLFGLVTAAAINYRSTATQPYEATLEVDGEVLVQPLNETRLKPMSSGDAIREGDTIRTETGGHARMIFFDGSELRLAPETTVQVKRMRATRFVSAEKEIMLVQQAGWARLVTMPTRSYERGAFHIQLDTLEVDTRSQDDEVVELALELRPMEPVPIDPFRVGPIQATVAVQGGSATVRAAGEEVHLEAGQKTSAVRMSRVPTPPEPPSPLTRQYVFNHDFQTLQQAGSDAWPRFWSESAQGAANGEVSVVYRQVDEELQPVIEFKRRIQATDHAATAITQPVNLPLSHFRRLDLSVRLQVSYHSLSGGGIKDSEYPIIVKLTYRDNQNHVWTWYRGFYTHNEENLDVQHGIKVEAGEWYTFEQDLLRLDASPAPIFIETIDVYAAGHDFESAVADVSIEGE